MSVMVLMVLNIDIVCYGNDGGDGGDGDDEGNGDYVGDGGGDGGYDGSSGYYIIVTYII